MKRCPKCRRDYYDETLLYCLDDGNALLDGPASVDEPATAIFSEPSASAGGQLSEAPTRPQIHTTAAEAEPRGSLGDYSKEKQRISAHRAATPQGKVGSSRRLFAVAGIVALVLVGGFFGYRYFAPTKQIESIAVMPFVNESGDADVEYLSDGMTETLINSLSQIPNLSVKARSSVFRYKGKEFDPKKIAAELNVQAILTGRIVQHGEQMTLNLELIDAQTENVLWGNKYDRKSSDLVSLQREIARDVSGKLKANISGIEAAKVEKNYTTNPEAYQLYLKGKFFWNKRTGNDLKEAAEFYRQAIEKDPNYALAFSGLAETYVLFGGHDVAPADDSMPLAKAAALRALEIDDSLAARWDII